MTLKDLLNKQDKAVLVKIAELTDNEFDSEKYNKFNVRTLASKIESTDRDIDDINDMLKTFGGIPLEDLESSESNEEELSEGIGTKMTTTKKMQSEAQNNANLQVRLYVSEAKKKALETVIVTVTPLDPRDIACNKECEAFTIENQYFAVGKVVPFNQPCEVERCIAELIRDTKIIKNIPNNPEEVKKTGKYSRQVVSPKYNIVINDKETFIESKKRGFN